METIEGTSLSSSAVIPFQTTAVAVPAPQTGGYEAVRFNAMKHGILSKLAVLAHEDHAEFADLLAAMVDEHQPAGVTERHLVDELAAIIWRKRRVLLAEGATINQGLKTAARNAASVIPAAAPFERGLSGKGTDIRDLMDLTPQEVADCQRDTRHDLEATQMAVAILRRGGAHAFNKALGVLLPASREWWEESVAGEEYPATAQGLSDFISDELQPHCLVMEKEARHHEAIKAQAIGEGLQAHRLEKLNRYETHLDRKFERTLAMLLKLKDLRNG